MKKLLLCFLVLMLVMMVFVAGVMAPNANAPNTSNLVSQSLPAEPAAIAVIVLVTAVIVTDTGQLARRAAKLLKSTGYNLLHAIGKVSSKQLYFKLRASYRPATGNPPEWGITRIKPITSVV